MSLTITRHSGKWNPLFRALETALVPSHACRDTLFRRCSAHRTLLRCSEPSLHFRKETLARHSIAVDCAVLYTDDMLSAARYIFAMACCAELVGVIYTRPRRVLSFRQPLAGSDGIEPSMQESNSCALPLGEPPIIPCSYCYME